MRPNPPGQHLVRFLPALAAVFLYPWLTAHSAPAWVQWRQVDGGNGHYYALTSAAKLWNDAEAEAVQYGGHLASITNSAEQQFVNRTFLSGPNTNRVLWIGLYDPAKTRKFVWVNGEPVSFTFWNVTEPNNFQNIGEYWVNINFHFSTFDPNSNSARPPLGAWNDAGNGPYLAVIESNTNYPPIVQITSPASGNSYNSDAPITVRFTATDRDDSISKIDAFADGMLLTNLAPQARAFTWANAPQGIHFLTVRATDSRGGVGVASPIQINVLKTRECSQIVYQSDFSGPVGPEWSLRTTDVTPIGGRVFLGQFGNQTATLLLTNLPPHTSLTIAFDLFMIRSWDGNQLVDPLSNAVVGPDFWQFSLSGVPVIRTTFSNINSDPPLIYPQAFPAGEGTSAGFPPQSGSVEKNTLGYVFDLPGPRDARDSVYHISVTRQHDQSAAALAFSASGLYTLADESWGLDNVRVEALPVDPPSIVEHPASTNVFTGDSVGFSVLASSSILETYQWSLSGTPIPGATNKTYFVPRANLADAGDYQVAVENCYGRIESAVAHLNVLIPNQPPAVLIITPVSGSHYLAGTNISLRATATDPDGTIASLTFYANQQFLGTGTNNQLIWTNVSRGNYTLTAVATDDHGMATSAPVNIFVEALKIPPTIKITQPISGAVFLENSDIDIQALATDSDGSIVRVEFYETGTNIVSEASTAPHESLWRNPTAGEHILSAVAFDNDGLSSTSAPVTIQVQALPIISVASTNVPEGNDGPHSIFIPVQLSRSSIGQVSLNYETIPGTASSPADFAPASGTIVFFPGETNKLIEISLVGDPVYEPDEKFQISFSSVTNAIGLSSPIDVSILNDDAMPELKIGNVIVTEGDQGTTDAVFQVSLAGASSSSVSVSYETRDGTALAGTDYLPQSGVLVFDAVTNTAIAAASFSASQTPVLQISDSPAGILLTWTNSGQNVQLQETSSLGQGEPWLLSTNQPVTAGTVSSTRIASSVKQQFYRLVVGSTLGSAAKEIRVPIIGDKIVEDTENFFLILSGNVNATINSAQSQATIIDNDQPFLSIDDISVTEGNAGTVDALFSVTLSSPSPRPLTVSFSTLDGTAKAGTDYDSTSGVISFNPGETKQNITVKVHGDILFESSEGFALQLSGPTNAVIAKASGLCTIVNDDTLPALSIDSATLAEGSGGTTPILLTVHLSAPALQPVTVNYATADGTAQAGADYLSQNGTLTFAPGETAKTIPLSVVADAVVEPAEAFVVNLSNPVSATVSGSQAVITITDDDGQAAPPQVAITNPENDDTLPLGSPIVITASVNLGTSPVDKIEFFANGQSLGVASSSQVAVTWNNASQGTYNLTAVAYDSAGRTGQSAPVRIQVVPNDGKRRVAIIQNFADAEISKLQTWLKDMDLGSRVFSQEGLTYDQLSSYDLIIWDDLGVTADGLTANDVSVFNQAYTAGKPLYFIGSKLVQSGAVLASTSQGAWNRLLHLASGGAPATDSRITVRDQRDPINNGPFGLVGEFKDVTLETAAAASLGGEQVVARTSQTDAVISTEDSAGVRIITQDVLAYHGSGLNAAVQREKLFKNAVWWLLRLPPPPPFLNLGLNLVISPETPAPGQEFTITASAQHNGEAEATGVTLTMVLPPNVSFVRASSEAGECVYDDGVVICSLGKLFQSAATSAVIVLRWNTGPAASVFSSVSPNQPEARTDDNSATVLLGKNP